MDFTNRVPGSDGKEYVSKPYGRDRHVIQKMQRREKSTTLYISKKKKEFVNLEVDTSNSGDFVNNDSLPRGIRSTISKSISSY